MPQKESLYPTLNLENNSLNPVLNLEDNGLTFRLNKISGIQNFLDSEVDSRGRLCRKYKSAYNTLFNLNTISGIGPVCFGTSGAIALSTGVGVIVGIPLGIVSAILGATSVGSSAICKLLLKKIEKHQKLQHIAMVKMSSINNLVSRLYKITVSAMKNLKSLCKREKIIERIKIKFDGKYIQKLKK